MAAPTPPGSPPWPAAFVAVPALSRGSRPARGAILHADNLRALRALHDTHRGQVRCIYLDPPYHNRERYTHYTDQGGHDAWLEAVCLRLEAAWPLLAPSGSLWISIDDHELHHLKVAADRLLGRNHFVTTVVWQMRTTRENRRTFSNDHEYLLVYAADPRAFRRSRGRLPPSPALLRRYRNPDDDPRGPWQSVSLNAQAGHATAAQFYPLVAPSGRIHHPPEGRCWVYTRERMQAELATGNLWFGRDGGRVPRRKMFLADATPGLTPHTLWTAAEVGTSDEAKKEILRLFPDQPVFDTPKPERLLERILQIASRPGEWVLDAYLGSGTTAAVAHRLGRRYIGIEQGDHAADLCVPRLARLIAAEDDPGFTFLRPPPGAPDQAGG